MQASMGGLVKLGSGRFNDEKALLGLGPVAGINEPAAFHADVLLGCPCGPQTSGFNYYYSVALVVITEHLSLALACTAAWAQLG